MKPFLLTNDDGPSSPLLAPFLKQLQNVVSESIHICIPDSERSWISQALRIERNLRAHETTLGDCPAYLLNGTPAECASIAIEHWLKQAPCVCVSGINVGTNAGVALYHNSGTVGAARQAALYGIPSIAISVFLPDEIFAHWANKDSDQLSALNAEWERIAECAATTCQKLFRAHRNLQFELLNVNLPWLCSAHSSLVYTRLAATRYTTLFDEVEPHRFQLKPSISSIEIEAPCTERVPHDFEVLQEGNISITPIRLNTAVDDSIEQIRLWEQTLATTENC